MSIYLDIETLDFFQDAHIKALPRDEQLKAMRFGCAVTYTARADLWHEWSDSDLFRLWLHIQMLNDLVIGWNIADFDIPVMTANLPDYDTKPVIRPERIVDLFALIRQVTGRWYSLETIAQHNLGRGKLAYGQKAAEWLRSGDPALITAALEYCRYDVQLTIDLHAILLKGEPLRLPPRAKRQELNEVLWWLDGRTEWLPDTAGNLSTK